jgi:hypothetical protein
MKQLLVRFRLVVLVAITTMIALATSAGAQAATVVVGTGNPDVDVPAVQAAVDQGGEVILRGHFSFDRSPTIPMDTILPGLQGMVLVSKAVTISGARHERDGGGEMTSIEAGTFPFFVNAAGSGVTIQQLRFVRPKGDAIFVYAVTGLVIASSRIEGVERLPAWGREAIDIITTNGMHRPQRTRENPRMSPGRC